MSTWEERLSKEQRRVVDQAIKKFRGKKGRTKDDEHVLYVTLTKAGVTAEEADEVISLEAQADG